MKVIDLTLLDMVSSEAKDSPRLRMNYNFHQSWMISVTGF